MNTASVATLTCCPWDLRAQEEEEKGRYALGVYKQAEALYRMEEKKKKSCISVTFQSRLCMKNFSFMLLSIFIYIYDEHKIMLVLKCSLNYCYFPDCYLNGWERAFQENLSLSGDFLLSVFSKDSTAITFHVKPSFWGGCLLTTFNRETPEKLFLF